MARTPLVAAVSTSAGTKLVDEASGDVANGHVVNNSGKTRIIVRNSGASPRDFTVRFFRTVDNSTVTSKVRAIPAGETWVFGPYDRNDYGSQLLVDVANAELKLRVIE